ncbi:retrotransposon gag protein [Tanacetum coccineum]
MPPKTDPPPSDKTMTAMIEALNNFITTSTHNTTRLLENQDIIMKQLAVHFEQTNTLVSTNTNNNSNNTNNNNTNNNNTNNYATQIRPPKLTLPTFDGSNPLDWLFQADQYFTFYNIQPPQRLAMISFHLSGDALSWHKYLYNNNLLTTWEAFTRALETRFGPSSYDNHQAALFKLKQTSTVTAYQTEFERLSNCVVGLPPEALLNCFLSGLRQDIQQELSILRPHTITQAIGLAKLIEEKPNDQVSTPTGSTLLAAPSRSSETLPVKRFSPTDMQKRRAEGLCYNCPEKYHPGCSRLVSDNSRQTDPDIASSSDHISNADTTGPPSTYAYLGSCDQSYASDNSRQTDPDIASSSDHISNADTTAVVSLGKQYPQHCGLRFWYQERVKNIPSNAYPEYIKLLLADRHFLENIRAYNQMFSMTSLGSLCPADGEPPWLFKRYEACRAGRLFQQYVVTALCAIEQNRIDYIREHQKNLDARKNLDEADKEKVVAFAKWLLDIGDGCTGKPDDTDPENTSWVDIPPAYSIPNDEHGISNLIKFIYDDDTLQFPTAETLQQKAIVCPENETADMINSRVLSMLPGTTRTYKSFDEATPHGHDGGEVELLYPTEYLNTLSFAGLPSHNLELKVGTPIMLLRNINIVGGLCNGTRMIVKQLLPKVIEAQIITGTRVSQKVYLPRIPLTLKDPKRIF